MGTAVRSIPHFDRYSAEHLDEADRLTVRTPRGFTLAGYGRADLADGPGERAFVIDAHGMVLPNGTAVTICEDGECQAHIQVWESAEAAAEKHGSYIVYAPDAARLPESSPVP